MLVDVMGADQNTTRVGVSGEDRFDLRVQPRVDDVVAMIMKDVDEIAPGSLRAGCEIAERRGSVGDRIITDQVGRGAPSSIGRMTDTAPGLMSRLTAWPKAMAWSMSQCWRGEPPSAGRSGLQGEKGGGIVVQAKSV